MGTRGRVWPTSERIRGERQRVVEDLGRTHVIGAERREGPRLRVTLRHGVRDRHRADPVRTKQEVEKNVRGLAEQVQNTTVAARVDSGGEGGHVGGGQAAPAPVRFGGTGAGCGCKAAELGQVAGAATGREQGRCGLSDR